MICLGCGKNTTYVEVLWNDRLQSDARYCMQCATDYKRKNTGYAPHRTGFTYESTTQLPKSCSICSAQTYQKPRDSGKIYCPTCARLLEHSVEKARVVSIDNKEVGKIWKEAENELRCISCQNPFDRLKTVTFRGMSWCFECYEKFLGERTGSDYQVRNSYHCRLKVKGSQDNIDFFHWMMSQLDHDWDGDVVAPNDLCPECKGWEYHNPRFDCDQIREMGKLAGVKVKVKFWGYSAKCTEKILKKNTNTTPKLLNPAEGV